MYCLLESGLEILPILAGVPGKLETKLGQEELGGQLLVF